MFNQNSNLQQTTDKQARAIQTVEAITKDLPAMIKPILNNYLPALWANMTDESIDQVCENIKGQLEYIQTGVIPSEQTED